MRQVIIILLLFMTNQVFSQFCETFNQYALADGTNPNPIAVYNILDNWGARCSTLKYSDSNWGAIGSSRHLEVFDQDCPASNGSWVFNSTDFSGNWINGQQLSFDFRLLPLQEHATSTTESIYIFDGIEPVNSNLVARYVLNDPITVNDEWVSIVPQIGLMNQGSLPSSPLGYWEMVTGSDWDNLIQNVGGIGFHLDLSTGSAAFGIDNICMQECDWPFYLSEEELFQEFPLCYDDLPYVIHTKYFIAPSLSCEINGVVIMDANSGYYDPQYININEQTFTLSSPGEYVLELYAGGCHWTFELVIAPEIVIDLPSTYIACDGIFEEVCAPNGSNYTYEWYGPSPSSDESILLETGECYTPEQIGSYNLVVTDEYGCTSYHKFIVLEAIPEPILNDCIGERIDIDHLTYNNPNYEILWFHNGNLVQTGGATLLTSFTSGTITVEIGYGNCPPVSTSVTLKRCCPEDMFLSVDCENQQIVIGNYPANFSGLSISSWTFNGEPITPQGIFSSTFNTSYGNGVYGVSVLLILPGGEKCRFEETIVYREEDCCDLGLGPIANAQFVNIEGYETVNTIPHGIVEIPVLCDFLLNGTSSICEEEYIINIAKLDPVPWATSEVYPWTAFSGQIGMIDLENFVSFQPGQAYLLSLHAGPNGNTIHLPFIYGLDAEVEITNADDYYILEGTKYGDIEVAVFKCTRIVLDGSASTCENSYQVTIAPIDPIYPNWDTGTVFFNNWFTGQAPNNINIPTNAFDGQPTGYYLLTFAVGPVWTPEYKLIWWDECEDKQRNLALTSGFPDNGIYIEEQISVYPNPTNGLINLNTSFESGIYDVLDVNGKIIKHGVLSSKKSSIDLSEVNPGIYFFRVLDEEEKVYFEKVIKE